MEVAAVKKCVKSLLAFFLAAVLTFGSVPFTLTANAETSGIYTYTVSGGKATITYCSSSASGAITIPSTLGGYPVTAIKSYAFANRSGLTSVTIPNGVTSIEDSAFSRCDGLTNVTIPNSVTGIEDSTFYNCTKLTSMTFPNSVRGIGNSAFSGCTGLTSITIPDSVSSIGHDAFSNTAWLSNQPN